MQTYKDVCGNEEKIFFEIDPEGGGEFLKWAKEIGCVWLNGEEIDTQGRVDFFHLSTHSDGRLAYVSMMVWFSEQFSNVKRYYFPEYIKGNLISPDEYGEKRNT